MRRVKVLTAFLGAVISVTGSGALFASETINSVTVETKIVEYAEEMAVTTAASIETTAVPETTTTESVTTTTEETTTTTEETTTTTESTTEMTTTEQITVMTMAAPETAPAPVTTAAPVTTQAPVQTTEAASTEATAEPDSVTASNAITVSYSDYVLLCNVVAQEYGSDWVSTYDKALVVEVVMNRVNSASFPNTVYGVLTQRYQFSGSAAYVNLGTFSSKVTASVKAAVDLYLSDPTQFNHGYLYFTGNGKSNYFH